MYYLDDFLKDYNETNSDSSFNPNLTKSVLFQDPDLDTTHLLKRVAIASLPIITMYQPVSKIVNLSLHLYQLHLNLSNGISKQTIVHSALVTANIAASYLYPQFSALVTTTSELIYNLHALTGHIKDANVKLAALKLLHIMHNLINIGLLFHVTPERLLISLLIQAVKELHIAYNEYKSEHYLETAANILYALIRLKAAAPHYREVHRNFYGKEITQKDLDDLLDNLESVKNTLKPVEEIEETKVEEKQTVRAKKSFPQKIIEKAKTNPVTKAIKKVFDISFDEKKVARCEDEKIKVDLDRVLKKHHFRNSIRNVTIDSKSFNGVSFKNLKIYDSTFTNIKISKCSLSNLKVKHCIVKKSSFKDLFWKDCKVSETNLANSVFININFSSLVLLNSQVSDSTFARVQFKNCKIKKTHFDDTVFYHTFFEVSAIKKSHFHQAKIGLSTFSDSVIERTEFKETYFSKSFFDDVKFCRNQFLSSRVNQSGFVDSEFDGDQFTDSTFTQTNFRTIESVNSRFDKVKFDRCILKSTRLIKSEFKEVHFKNSKLKKIQFNWSKFSKTGFKNCNLEVACFNDVSLKEVSFTACKLSESTFFQTKVKTSKIIDSNLKDALLLDTKEQFTIMGGTPHEITRPVIGLLYNFKDEGAYTTHIFKAARKTGSIVLRFHSKPKNIDKEKLEQEIQTKIVQHQLTFSTKPIPQYIIKSDNPESEISKVNAYVLKIIQNVNGLIIGGGDDMEPEFYNRVEADETFPENTKLKSTVEFSLMSQAEKTNTPTLSICRGIQSLNIFRGGTLNQKVYSHWDKQHALTIREEVLKRDSGKVAETLLNGRNIIALSMHSQGIEILGYGLDIVMEHDGNPECVISERNPEVPYPIFIATQFHPEAHLMKWFSKEDLYKNNSNFFTNLKMRAIQKMNLT